MTRIAGTGGTVESGAGSRLGLYPRLLGSAWHDLDLSVRRAHADGAVVQAHGFLQIRHGTNRLARLILSVARVPPASEAAEVRLAVSRFGSAERWHRTLAGKPLVTVQREGPGGVLAERLGILEFRFRLTTAGGALIYRQVGLAVCLGLIRVPVPGWLAPRVVGCAGPAGEVNRTSIAVEVTAPTGSLLFSYQGSVRWQAEPR